MWIVQWLSISDVLQSWSTVHLFFILCFHLNSFWITFVYFIWFEKIGYKHKLTGFSAYVFPNQNRHAKSREPSSWSFFEFFRKSIIFKLFVKSWLWYVGNQVLKNTNVILILALNDSFKKRFSRHFFCHNLIPGQKKFILHVWLRITTEKNFLCSCFQFYWSKRLPFRRSTGNNVSGP